MAQQKCKRTNLAKVSPEKITIKKKEQFSVKIQYFETQQLWWLEDLTAGLVIVRVMLQMLLLWFVSLGAAKDAFTRALSQLHPRDDMPTPGEETSPLSPLYPGSNRNLLAPHSSFTHEQSQLKARALTNLL